MEDGEVLASIDASVLAKEFECVTLLCGHFWHMPQC